MMSVIYMDKESFNTIDESDIKRIYHENKMNINKFKKLEKQYLGEHKISHKTQNNANDPNNRLVNNMCKYVTDIMTGYFIGEPVVYSSDNDEYMEKIRNIFEYNDEEDENSELAKKTSIHGA